MNKKIVLSEKSWIALISVMSDYIFLASTIIEQNEQQDIKASDELIDDLEVNIATAGQILDQLMGEPVSKGLN